ncbi:MAG: DUF4830 domain-containing protein [Dysosmobacter welbionis]
MAVRTRQRRLTGNADLSPIWSPWAGRWRNRWRRCSFCCRAGGAYLTYNELQDSQGFDLSACCGKYVARYTYTVTNYPGRPEGVRPTSTSARAAGGGGYPLRRGRRIQDTLVYPEQD